MFKNKHITTSFIVAPILAVLSYFATDYIVSDLPSAAEDGASYALLARPNCRYESGVCTLVNGDFKIKLSLSQTDDGDVFLNAVSSTPIKGARLAFSNTALAANETTPEATATKTATSPESTSDALVSAPIALLPKDDSGESWQVQMSQELVDSQELRIALLVNETIFYGDTETTFFTYQTGFSQDEWVSSL